MITIAEIGKDYYELMNDDETVFGFSGRIKQVIEPLVDAANKWKQVEEHFNRTIRNGPHSDPLNDALAGLIGELITSTMPQATVEQVEPGGGQEIKICDGETYQVFHRPPISLFLRHALHEDLVVLLRKPDDEVTAVKKDTPCEIVPEKK